ncbi:protein PET100 homolog, mitochondrial [Rattus rattus]|nr:protein PET100 homolog, mitochondrial [Rattus rattus]XP_032742538.1 protein PET100 homolog, mitochondrial [Rattus rattus]
MKFCDAGESSLGGNSFVKPKSDMGVKLEVFRMSLYLTFPVVMFWISNQAEWFEDYVVQRKRELWPREKEGQRQELEEFKQKIRKQREERLLQAAQQSS